MGVGSKWDSKGASQSKVCNLQIEIAIDEKVLRLQVAMKDAMSVTVAYAVGKLSHELFNDLGIKRDTLWDCFHVLLEIHVEVLKDKVKFVALGVDDIEETHDVGIIHLLEEGDFANGSGRDPFIFLFETDLFEGDYTASVTKITSLVHNSIGA